MTAANPDGVAARKLLVIGDVTYEGESFEPAGAALLASQQVEAGSEVRLLCVATVGAQSQALGRWMQDHAIPNKDTVLASGPGTPLSPAVEAELMERLLDAFYWCDEVLLCQRGGGVLSPSLLMRLAALRERYTKPLVIEGELGAQAQQILSIEGGQP